MALIKSKEGKKIFIIREMLEAIKLSDGMNITKIIYKCNLNYQYAIKLLEDLAGRGVIQLIDYKGGIKYKITATGIKYLNDLKSI
ncbi:MULTISPECIES: winged helix-turn-helix domain-containing protein [Acidiplasma]|uniref:winged helix-turn-helix domain-containing protein n=2 Tax=Ferroplasmaceae TaxID=90142 RepID=UPI00138F3F98|nr:MULTISPECIES: winged helix-turn-helix domain-containing protein [Acidiplasma]